MSITSSYDANITRELGCMILDWNVVEQAMREMLRIIAFEINPDSVMHNLASQILLTELGTTALLDALNSYSTNILSADIGSAVSHAANYFERVRAYRNYYVHGLRGTVSYEEEPIGIVAAYSAKGKLVRLQDQVTQKDIARVATWSRELLDYVIRIIRHLVWAGPFPEPDNSKPPPLPQPPPLPDRLEKTALRLAELFPPPPAPQA